MNNKLDFVFSINVLSDQKDSLIFHEESWEECRELISQASRIIMCDDNEDKVWETYWKMSQYYQIMGRVDMRSNRNRKSFSVIGTYENVFSVQQIIREKLNYAAYAINEQYVQENSDRAIPWEKLSIFLQLSKNAIADHINAKVRILLDENITEMNADDMEKAAKIYAEAVKNPA